MKDLFINYRNDFILLIGILYIFNIYVGLITTVIYILIYILYMYNTNTNTNLNNIQINETNVICRPSTMNNPIGNYILTENHNIDACDDDINNKKNIYYNEYNLYEDARTKTPNSINKAHRNFYKMPNTSYPNDAIKFAKWLRNDNNGKLSCKTDNNCLLTDDVRFHSR